MKKAFKTNIDPLEIFLHGDSFYKLNNLILNTDVRKFGLNGIEIGSPAVVLSSLTSEIFLKCLICLETGTVPPWHNLSDLFNLLKDATKQRITDLWESEIVPLRKSNWDRIESSLGKVISRDLPTAPIGGSAAFEKIRYSYEGGLDDVRFFLSDLPKLLGKVILEIRPDWANVQKIHQELPTL